MWDVAEDDARGLLTVAVDEELGDGDLTRLKLGLKQQMAKLRVRHSRARVLFDLTRYPGTIADVLGRFQHVDGEFVQSPDDRVALLLRGSLDKVLARPFLHHPDQSALFVSAAAAATWLAA